MHQLKAKAAAEKSTTDTTAYKAQSGGYALIAAVYLFGIFMGALDMSIINPARTVVQNGFGVNDQLGVWLMTIYTLVYAASIPIMGKLADKKGRKPIFLSCVFLFGIGSLLCGITRFTDNFYLLLIFRAVQAFGGGGIVPIATAEFGTAFPEEKRGMALGLVGGVFGIASVFGAAAGSALLGLFGATEWQWIFWVNVPICLFIVSAGLLKIPSSTKKDVEPLDGLGIAVMTVMVLSLMYGLKNINFFDLASITELDVWPFLLIFVLLLPVFIRIEKRAVDPVMNLSYFKNRDIVITLACSIFTGIIMMANIFMPQFCENSLFMQSGSGGYFLIVLGLFAGIGSPMSGKLIDKHGVKPVLIFGFACAVVGSLFMAFVAVAHPNALTVIVTLALIGLGMGFTMGTPLNYMMLQKTDEAQTNSALAVLALVRSMGTAVAPAIMVAFIAHAGANMQDNLMNAMPDEVEVSPLPYTQELDAELAEMRSNEQFAQMLEGITIPNLSAMSTLDLSMDTTNNTGDFVLSDALLERMENSDVTNIVAVCKEMSIEMFAQVKPEIQAEATAGIAEGIRCMQNAQTELDAQIAQMQQSLSAFEAMPAAQVSAMNIDLDSLRGAYSEMQAGSEQLHSIVSKLQIVEQAIPAMIDEAQENYLLAIDANAQNIQNVYRDTLNEGFKGMFILVAVTSALGILLVMLFRGKQQE